MDNHLLSLVLFTPLAGLLVLLFIPSSQKSLIKIWDPILKTYLAGIYQIE